MSVQIVKNWANGQPLPEQSDLIRRALYLQHKGRTITEISAQLKADRSDIEHALYWSLVKDK